MAHAPTNPVDIHVPSASRDIPPASRLAGDNTNNNKHALFAADGKLASLLTPPNSISPELAAHGVHAVAASPPPINIIEEDAEMKEDGQAQETEEVPPPPAGTPLSKGALSGLDASAAITPAMLARDHLPGIMLGNGPRPIRYVMGELTQSVPGFSRIPPAKARRLVVAALESRQGGGVDGSVAFCKTGWGRWDAHIKGSCKDSGIGSFNDGHLSPPRSERSSYCMSNGDSAMHMPRPRREHRDHHSRESWTESSLREEDEEDMDMDVNEMEADKMSLDGFEEDDSNDDTDDDDWAAVGTDALRKASLPPPGAPRLNYNAISLQAQRSTRGWSRRPSGPGPEFRQQASPAPYHNNFYGASLDPASATPEDKAAAEALISLGSM